MSPSFLISFLLAVAILSAGLLLHSYALYPALLWVLDRTGRRRKGKGRSPTRELPRVSVLMAAYNEEAILPQKLANFTQVAYPQEKLGFFFGSDASTDRTVELLREASQRLPSTRVFQMPGRTGKPGIINFLAEQALAVHGRTPDHLFVITDASIMLEPDVISRLAEAFRDPSVAVADTVLVPLGTDSYGVSRSEQVYLSGESKLKYREGKIWGCTIGPFGGCYALRSTYFHPIPPNFLVDDFFIAMKALEQGGVSLSLPGAIVREPATHELSEEFRRKVRISTGNFQNLLYFKHLWWPVNSRLAFAFFSHKVLRWMGPACMLVFGMCSLGLVFLTRGPVQWLFGGILMAGLLLPAADWALQKAGVNLFPLRSVRYFVWMNLALGIGALKFIKGVDSNVWQPTKRSGNHLSSQQHRGSDRRYP